MDGLAESFQLAIARATRGVEARQTDTLTITQPDRPETSTRSRDKAVYDAEITVTKYVEPGRVRACAYNDFSQDFTILLGFSSSVT